jgi:hypothetical protein
VSQFFFQIIGGKYEGISELANAEDRDAAWAEMLATCSDLARDVTGDLKPNSEWRMTLFDASRKPVFRIRLLAEALGGPAFEPRQGAVEPEREGIPDLPVTAKLQDVSGPV